MPYYKFKPWKQYGRFNTRLFKKLLQKKNNQVREPFYVDPELLASNVEIHDPLNSNFFNRFNNNNTLSATNAQHLKKSCIEDHPLFKSVPCYLFESKIGLTDGVDEACAIIKATAAKSFPNEFFTSSLFDYSENIAEEVKDCIMHGERYDPTLEKLPKRHDPVIFWTAQNLLYGTPVTQRNNIIMHDLYRKVVFAAASKQKSFLSDLRSDLSAYLSAYLPAKQSGFQLPLVLRQQPYLIIQSTKPLTLLANQKEVEETKSLIVPNIYPISPVIDLQKEHIYNDNVVLPRSIFSDLYIDTLFSSRLQDQKYPWTREQNAANAILNCFGAALAQAIRSGAAVYSDNNSKVLKQPILTKSVQLINGRFDLVAVQLNTLNLSADENEVKNLVWLEKAASLYTPKPFYENMNEVSDLNMETFRKFAAFVLYR